MEEGKVPGSVHLAKTIAELVPRVQKLAVRLLSLCNINRTVHQQTYNRLIRDAAIKRDRAAKEEARRSAEAERKARVAVEVKRKKARVEEERAQATTLSAALEAMERIQAKKK
jgi:hypothetical protein